MKFIVGIIVFYTALYNVRPSYAEERSANQKTPRVDILLSAVMPFDFEHPTIKVTYAYVAGDKVEKLWLPTKEEMIAFDGLSLLVDGEKAPRIFTMAEGILTYQPQITPGQQVELVVPLEQIYRLPKSWKVMEVTYKELSYSHNGAVGSLKIVRYPVTPPKEPRVSLEVAAVSDAPATTLAFTVTNISDWNLVMKPIGSAANPITIVKPDSQVVQYSFGAGEVEPVAIEHSKSMTWKINVSDAVKDLHLDAPGLYRIYCQVEGVKSPEFLLLKEKAE